MSNLFGIAQKYDYLVSQIEENDGEITEEIAEELAIAESELEDKLRAYRQIIDAQKANIAYNKDEIKRLRDRNTSFDKIAGRLKSSVVDALHIFGQVGKSGNYSLKFPDFTVYTKESESVSINENALDPIITSLLHITEASLLPEDNIFDIFVEKYKEELDKIASISITVDVPISLAKEVGRYIHDKLGDDYIYTVKFDKKAIKELDNWAKASNESDEDIARAERIAHVMDKIDMEIVTSETAIYK